MAANSRFDLTSSSPDGPTYSNGHRVPYAAIPIEKLGSFREGSDRILTSPPGTSKSSATSFQGEMTCLLQSLALDFKVIAADQKLNRPVEMKRAVSSIFGVSAEDPSPVTFSTKPLPSSLEEIKRLKNNLQEGFIKARDRAKSFGDASMKIEKFCYSNPRKRSRVDSSSGERSTGLYQGGNILKVGPQSHLSGCGLDIGSQRLEEKVKIGVPNRRIRTSLVDANGTARNSGLLERDKDLLKLTNSSVVQVDETDRAFSTVADGWDMSKMKKKRSVIKSDVSTSSGLLRSQGGDQETKRGMQQKLGIDARPRLNHPHSFRLGSDNNTSIAGKLDSSTQQNGPGMRSRNEQNNVLLPNDRRDARFCPDTESASLRVIAKPNSREDTCAASPTLLKFGSARGPRSHSCAQAKTSPNIHRVVGNPETMEPPQTTDKINTVGVINRKRAASIRSSSPPVGQWAVQRPKKVSRSSRRSSLSPRISSHDEFSMSEAVDDAPISHDVLGLTRRPTTSQQNKIKGDNFASPSLSESEESGVQENKLKDKVKNMDGKASQTLQKFANNIIPPKKKKMAAEENSGDGDRRQGRIVRGFTSARPGISATIEKLGDAVTIKQQRSVRPCSERVESKPGRPPLKKLSERKSFTRPRQSINILSLDSSDEATDDHEELLAAATAALDNGGSCSCSFWKQVEPVFSFVSSEDSAFLHKQIQLTNDSASRIKDAAEDSHNVKIDYKYFPVSSAPVFTKIESNDLPNGMNFYECERESVFTEEVQADPSPEQFMLQNGSNTGVSIFQTLLSAIIEEDDMEDIYNTIDYGEAYSYNDSYAAQFVLEKDVKTKGSNLSEDSRVGRDSDCYTINVNWRLCDEISRESLGANGNLETFDGPFAGIHEALKKMAPNQTAPLSTGCTEFQYNKMSINERLILELSEIGLYPEPVPDLKHGEGEDVTEGIHILDEKLQEQAANRKNLIIKLEKAVMNEKEVQVRKLEHLAMDHLVRMAYGRYMACCGPNAPGSKNANKFAKRSAMAFVKRTLARCRKFEETGISCFNEPVFRDIFLSASSHSNKFQNVGNPADDHNPFISSQITGRVDAHAKCTNAARTVTHSLEHSFNKDDPLSNRVKKKEALLDDVVGSTAGPATRALPVLGSSFANGAKGKRSDRDRDAKGHNRDLAFNNGTAKVGRTAASSCKGERKNKTKPKQKTTQLSASMNVPHSKPAEESGTPLSFNPKSSGSAGLIVKEKEDSNRLPGPATNKSSINGDAIDLSHLQLPDMDVDGFGGQSQDFASWLNFEEEGLQDHDDCMGLEIPMDDLSDVHLMI